MNNRLFIDTSYLLALVNQRDKYHALALEFAGRLNEPAVISNAILLELGNSLAKGEMRKLAVGTIAELRSDPQIEIITISPAIMDEALQLFASRMDKEWGLVDCTSFVIMRQNGLTHALTTDRHFLQAGFQVVPPFT